MVLFLPDNWLKLGFLAVLVLAALEWGRLAQLSKNYYAVLYALLVAVLAYAADRYSQLIYLQQWLYPLSILWWALVCTWIVRLQKNGKIENFSSGLKLWMGLFTLLPVWHALVDLHAVYDIGPELTLYLIVLVSMTDIGAYVVGRLMGRIKLAPVLSPGKTIEGVIGGVLVALLLSICAAYYFKATFSQTLFFVTVSVFVAAISVVGDLFESLLKRQAAAKDSGRLIPGHGGVLDRIDSLSAAAPLFYFGFIHLIK